MRNAFETLLENARTLHGTSYVLVETVAFLQHRIGLEPVRDLEEHLVALFFVEWISAALQQRATRWCSIEAGGR